MKRNLISLTFSLIFSLGILESEAMAQDVMMSINNADFTVKVDEKTEAGKAFLAALPLSLSFENFGANERIAYLSPKLALNSYKNALNVSRGDITYYVPWGNIAVFKKSYASGSDLAPIGSMDEDAMSALEKSGNNEVTFKLK